MLPVANGGILEGQILLPPISSFLAKKIYEVFMKSPWEHYPEMILSPASQHPFRKSISSKMKQVSSRY